MRKIIFILTIIIALYSCNTNNYCGYLRIQTIRIVAISPYKEYDNNHNDYRVFVYNYTLEKNQTFSVSKEQISNYLPLVGDSITIYINY